MLTIRPAAETDYTAIVNWNADKDEAYLFQWAGFTAYQHPLTEEQIAKQAKKDDLTIFMILENETPIGTAELCDIMKKRASEWRNILKKKTLTGIIIPWNIKRRLFKVSFFICSFISFNYLAASASIWVKTPISVFSCATLSSRKAV